ncbi:MAG: carboxymuconolactone decarboxylase family protein [Rhodopirellula sp. JB055]|uniref:carboxymuconolactone decarboxylase family protein n=1 Tax=Rhodopirellula sp. JB055 TaxID=3342846 RepID=UPI00370AADB3
MAYAQPLSINEAPDEAKPILEAIEKKFGQSMNIFSTLAHQPDVLAGMTQINDGLENDLPAKYRELAYYKASQLNSCDYCSHYHRQAAKKAGLSDEQLDSMNVSGGDLLDEKEQAVLKYAEQLTTKANVDASVVKELKLFLNEKQLVTLAAAVALANFTNRINHGLDIELP